MKKCLYCAEEIQTEAIKCRYCGEMAYVSNDINDDSDISIDATTTYLDDAPHDSLPPVYYAIIAICVSISLLGSLASIELGDYGTLIKYIIATIAFLFISPFIWKTADALRSYAEPTAYFGRGFWDMVFLRYFWTYGPQTISLIATIFIIGFLIGQPQKQPSVEDDSNPSTSPTVEINASEPASLKLVDESNEDRFGESNLAENDVTSLIEASLTLDPQTGDNLVNGSKIVTQLTGNNSIISLDELNYDYKNFYLVKKDIKVLGGQLLLFNHQHMKKWLGCCPNEGNQVLLEVKGDLTTLKEFATTNKCSIEVGADINIPDEVWQSLHLSGDDNTQLVQLGCQKDYRESNDLQESDNPIKPSTSSVSTENITLPSFECAKATLPQELLICTNNDLAIMDIKMATLYMDKLAQSYDKNILKQAQKDWLNERNLCADEICLIEIYDKRLLQLNS